jgi:hypothetical protein
MHETDADLAALQDLLDASHAAAGAHLRSIFGDDTRLTAAALAALLPGVQILDLATVTATGAPRVAPVDGLFYRGKWHFGSARNSVRARHLAARPAASAAHTRGEGLCVITHGQAVERDLRAADHDGLVHHLHDVYPDFDEWASLDGPYWALEPERMFVRSPGS